MKYLHHLSVAAFAVAPSFLFAQNTFPTTGNVGIGTTTPQTTVHIKSSAIPTILFDEATTGGLKYSVSARWGGYFTIWNETTPGLSSDPRFAIHPGGSIGIGTLFPLGALGVQVSSPFGLIGNNNTIALRNSNATPYNATSILNFDSSNAYIPNAAIDFLNANHGGATGVGIIRFYTKQTDMSVLSERVRIDNLGRVGIGTDAPAARLHVVGGASIFHADDWGNDTIVFRGQKDTTNKWGEYAIRTGYLGLTFRNTQTNNSLFTIGNGGNIGINETSPSSKLMISGSLAAPPVISLNESNVRQWKIGPALAGSGKLSVQNGSTGTDAMTVDATNNVGIGTSSPTHKLSVNGAIRAKEVIVETTGWPDYVFTKEHGRTSLEETEAFIDQNGHLPGIPSAAEVAENGVSVGELQVKLLQKLEEMTLHQIEMQKTISTLQHTVTTLKVRITELEGNK